MDNGSQSSQLWLGQPTAASGKRHKLQHKVTVFAIALSTLPVVLIGSAAYLFASRSITQQVIQEKRQRTEVMGDKLDQFLVSRLREVESLAVNPVLTQATLRNDSSPNQQQLLLTEFANSLDYFDSIILFDLDGNPVAQATTGKPFVGNYGDREYFQAAVKTGQSTMNGPGLSSSSGLLRVEYAVPVKDLETGNSIYIIRARVPGHYMSELFEIFEEHKRVWHLFNSDGMIFASARQNYLAQTVESYYPSLMEIFESRRSQAKVFANSQEDNRKQLVAYAPVNLSNSVNSESIGALITADTAIAFAPQYQLLRIFALGTGLTAVIVGAITTYVANRVIRPIQHLTQVAQQVTHGGNFALRAKVNNQDEIGLLANSLNQLITWIGQYTEELERSQEGLEQRVKERTEQLDAIIDNLGDGLLVIDSTGTIIRCNPVLVHMFNLYAKTVTGSPCHEVFQTDLSQLIAKNQADPTQLLITDVELPNNGIGQALVTAVVSNNSNVVPGGDFDSIVLIRDITAEKEVDQMKTDFISTVSHELRTPLTSILGFAKLIQKKLEDTVLPAVKIETKKTDRAVRQVRDNLGIIISEGERLTSLINDVLDISKIEAGKIEWNMQPSSISDLIERAISATSVLAQNNGLEIVLDVEPELPKVVCDRNRIIQVLINLISNAIKFSNEGVVTCFVRHQDIELSISIIDTGIGLSTDDLEKVFEKFTQVGKVMTDKPKGTGLGLPICRQIIEYHGGRIWAESALGQGSTFTFTLPLTADLEAKPTNMNLETLVQQLKENVRQTVAAAPVTDTPQKTILVVDDEPHIRQLLRQELEAVGYKVQMAKDGMDALNQVKASPPDLMVLDMMMPNINGFDLVAILKHNPATMGIPIIVVSIVQDQERGYRLGVDRYLSKPIDTEVLLKDIKTLLDQGTSNRQVLVVDIDTSMAKTLTDVLLSKGYTVTESTTGKDGIEKALSLKPEMIIVDSAISMEHEVVNTLQFDNGLENIFLIMVENSQVISPPDSANSA
ncbi:response regulator [Leptothoe sp. LEGE 181152]|nr:response regulator [Leptothoe sp. LEGE 181152]